MNASIAIVKGDGVITASLIDTEGKVLWQRSATEPTHQTPRQMNLTGLFKLRRDMSAYARKNNIDIT